MKKARMPCERTDMKNQKQKGSFKGRLIRYLKKSYMLYLFLLPAIIYTILFDYMPMYGIQIAFKDFRPDLGIQGSGWVGFKYFKMFFDSYQFENLIKNTVILSFYALIAGFPIPIVLAFLLNYTKSLPLKKATQMVTYAPHFISTVVFCGMLFVLLGTDGIYNQLLGVFGIKPIGFMTKAENFRHVYVWSGIIQQMGWNSIIYIAALTSVSPEIHEAAIVDGASKLDRIIHIDWPSIMPTAVMLLILSAGRIMTIGFEKAFLMQNNLNLDYSEIIATYVYKIGIQGGQLSLSSAIGLFNNVINFALLLVVNRISKKLTKVGVI